MLHITSLNEGLELFKALGSDVRIEILNILMENFGVGLSISCISSEVNTRWKIRQRRTIKKLFSNLLFYTKKIFYTLKSG